MFSPRPIVITTRLKELIHYQRALGVFVGLRWWALRSADRHGWLKRNAVLIRPRHIAHSLISRMGKSSDPDVFDQILTWGGLEPVRSIKSPKVVIDLGANVGYASAFFLNAFPEAHILAVEPDPDNVAVCRLNLSHYGARVHIVEGAAWYRRCHLALSRGKFRDGREWATQVRESGHPTELDVEGWDLSSLIDMCPQKTVDLLKIDIEGSEKELFSYGADRWLDHVRNMCIEAHGEDCESAILAALKGYEYNSRPFGEYSFYLNIRRESQVNAAGPSPNAP